MKIILAIIIFSALVLFHELGHFIFAKLNDVKVNQFCLGLGPTILKWGKGETKYCLNLLPFGGACVMEGEDGGSEDNRAFNNKSILARFLIVFGGPLFNFILAYFLAVIYISCIGVDLPVIDSVVDGYSAKEAGIEAGDTIIKLDNYHVHFYQEVSVYTFFHSGDEIKIEYERDGQRKNAVLKPKLDKESGRYLIGISSNGKRTKLSPINNLAYGAYEVKNEIFTTFESLKMLCTGKVSLNDMSGPVGIVTTIGDIYDQSVSSGAFYIFINMLSISILLSANLGVMNLLPLPALDGGRILLLLIELIRRKKLPPEIEEKINFAGFAMLMLLMVVIMYNDIIKIVK